MKALLLTLLVISSFCAADDQQAEINAYKAEADKWVAYRKEVEDCKDKEKLAEFMVNAANYTGTQISEDNSEFLEKLAIDNPICAKSALHLLKIENRNLDYKNFIVNHFTILVMILAVSSDEITLPHQSGY